MARVLGEGDQEATMMDLGDKERPPGEPPDGTKSWLQTVVGSQAGGVLRPEVVMDDAFVTERMGLAFPNGEDGEPVITIGREVLEAMNGLWKRCMIVKVLGRNISIAAISRKLREMWKPKGEMFVTDLPRQFFMVRFDVEEEYMEALTGGPWRVFGSYLMVQAWTPEFDPLRDEITTTPVWVRFSNIPVTFYHRSILMGIAKGLGKPIRVDLTTLNFERARFARVCVEVNLKKPLKGTIVVNEERYYVSYEGLPNICSLCGLYGHLVHQCPKRVVQEKAQERQIVGPQTHGTEKASTSGVEQGEDGFTLVRKNGKRPGSLVGAAGAVGASGDRMGRNLREITKGKDSENIVTSNRFGSLETDMVARELREVAINSGANKENECLGNQGVKGKSIEQGKGVVFGAGSEALIAGNLKGKNDKRAGGVKPMEKSVVRPKVPNLNRPVRGLVFGPTKSENSLSLSGKRLRVEKDNVRRMGGAFVSSTDGDKDMEVSGQSRVEGGQNTGLSLMEVSDQPKDGVQNAPMDESAGRLA